MKAAASKPYLLRLTEQIGDLADEVEEIANGEEDERIAELSEADQRRLLQVIEVLTDSAMGAVNHLKGGAE